jgi:hypothetical protein
MATNSPTFVVSRTIQNRSIAYSLSSVRLSLFESSPLYNHNGIEEIQSFMVEICGFHMRTNEDGHRNFQGMTVPISELSSAYSLISPQRNIKAGPDGLGNENVDLTCWTVSLAGMIREYRWIGEESRERGIGGAARQVQRSPSQSGNQIGR